ncbi:hypothetical protein SFRURICE_013515 [Spodoptera frugiperda]|nr:hypothetical protein SFRURICE_013515 [Spodoptera frugiperda]
MTREKLHYKECMVQCSGVFMVVSTVDPGLQELQQCGRKWRACPIKKKGLYRYASKISYEDASASSQRSCARKMRSPSMRCIDSRENIHSKHL